jgi:hypothetical protein
LFAEKFVVRHRHIFPFGFVTRMTRREHGM